MQIISLVESKMLFVLTGKSAILSADFNPPIDVSDGVYELGVTNFEVYNSIPNIDEENNKFFFGDVEFKIPTGCYQLTDINNYLQHVIEKQFSNDLLSITANNNTLHTHIKATKDVDFTKPNTIGPVLGFNSQIVPKNIGKDSDNIADIMKLNSIMIECNITIGSFKNGEPVHIIYQFFPNVPPGFKIVQSPDHVIYLPISVKTIRNITLKIIDQDEKLVNFQQETVTVGLHLQKKEENGY